MKIFSSVFVIIVLLVAIVWGFIAAVNSPEIKYQPTRDSEPKTLNQLIRGSVGL